MVDLFLKAALVGDVWVLYLLVLSSILSVAVIYERWRVFRRNREEDSAALMDGIAAELEKNSTDKALQLAQASQGVGGRVAAACIQNFSRGSAAVEEVLSAWLIRERQALERNLVILGTLGNNAPFLGLFGTVLGIIKAFNDLAISGSSGVSVVMAGISSALVSTAFGILLALPAVIANNYFQTRLRRILADSESLGRLLLSYLKTEGGKASRTKEGAHAK